MDLTTAEGIYMTRENGHKDWTVMVYLATENTLAQENVFNLTEMKSVGQTVKEKMNVIAWLETGFGLNGGQAYELTKGTSETETTERPLSYFEDKDVNKDMRPRNKIAGRSHSTDPQPALSYVSRIIKFVDSVKKHHPAKHYALILSGHGEGWVGDFVMEGDDTRGALTLPQVKELLERQWGENDNSKIDILGMDSCLMCMTEVCYEVREHAKILIGAEGFEPLAGWPYAAILKLISDESQTKDFDTDKEMKDLAKKIVEEYIKYYSDYADAGISVDQSACDVSKMAVLTKAIQSLSQKLMSKFNKVGDEVILAHWESQQYRAGQYVDLYDFCDKLQERLRRKKVYDGLITALGKVKKAIQGTFVVKSCYSGPLVQYSYGVSIYFPWAKTPHDFKRYKTLSFSQQTKWGEFLEMYLTSTQRAVRGDNGQAVKPTTPPKQQGPDAARSKYVGARSVYLTRNGSFNRDVENAIGSMNNPATQYRKSPCTKDMAVEPAVEQIK
jgi:hypothetical protein